MLNIYRFQGDISVRGYGMYWSDQGGQDIYRLKYTLSLCGNYPKSSLLGILNTRVSAKLTLPS